MLGDLPWALRHASHPSSVSAAAKGSTFVEALAVHGVCVGLVLDSARAVAVAKRTSCLV